MSTFKERLELEYVELKVKSDKLSEFIDSDKFYTIDYVQRSLLRIQLKAMETYLQCLIDRIDFLEHQQ